MERTFTANVSRKRKWFIAQCIKMDIASQRESEEQALANLREALELYFEEPQATLQPKMRHVKVEIRAA